MTSLDEYAAARGVRTQGCTICSLPDEVQDVIQENEQRAQPHSRRVVAAWATEQSGTKVSHDMIYRHLNHN